jgi:hypothetical protein
VSHARNTRNKRKRGQCPRPDKIRYADQGSAQKALAAMRKYAPDNRDLDGQVAYWCDCGAWHLGHKQRTGRIVRLLDHLPPSQRIA